MIYADLHCDTITECLDRGYSLSNSSLHVNLQKLESAGCIAQCFAIFTEGSGARDKFYRCLSFYQKSGLNPNISLGERQNTAAILTVENLGFTQGDEEEILKLKGFGVKMASLVWNNENALAYPNLIIKNGVPDFAATEERGLKNAGRRAVEILDSLNIILDLSHLSDGGVNEVLKNRKIPTVASHSNSRSVCNISRNLTDSQIRAIASTGGIVGVNFCKDFLGEGDVFSLVLAHVKHIINVGGEDVIAFGSDFDGIPTVKGLEGCEKMPALINYLSEHLTFKQLEKLCYKNFLRVMKGE